METPQTGKTAAFWVKVPRIPRNGLVRIEVCSGHAGARTAADGKKTFLFFDDFLGDYQGAGHKNCPPGWESTYKDGNNCNWIVKDGVILFRGSGHLTTARKVWPSPANECYTLRCRAKWPKPAFVNPQENGLSFGGVSFSATDGNAWMNLFALYQKGTLWNGKILASFGSMPAPTGAEASKDLVAYLGANCLKFELKPFTRADHGSFLTFEIERQPDETINRIIDTGEEVRSILVIPGELHLMMHGCDCGFPNSAYLSVDWMLLRKQAYPNPSYGQWKEVPTSPGNRAQSRRQPSSLSWCTLRASRHAICGNFLLWLRSSTRELPDETINKHLCRPCGPRIRDPRFGTAKPGGYPPGRCRS
jgi:hypothetical protein